MPDETLIHYTPKHSMHRSPSTSPECPERLTRIVQYLEARTDVLSAGQARIESSFEPATLDDIQRVHTKGYVEFISRYSRTGGGFLGDSTYVTSSTYNAALLAAGGAIAACMRASKGGSGGTYALVRPPGHHASEENYGGYCIFNNAAVGARYVQATTSSKKIAIVDWDAHAGNGTMRVFYEDPTVLTISIHRDPHEFYPHDGFFHQIGKGEGRGHHVNIELPEGSGDTEYALALQEVVMPVLEQFKPDLIIGCNGLDAHFSDQTANLKLTCAGYHDIVSKIASFAGGHLALVHEGGYGQYTGQIVHSVLNALCGKPCPYEDDFDPLSYRAAGATKIRERFVTHLKELKKLLGDWYKF